MEYKNYLKALYREYKYKIKTVTPLDDKKLDIIERSLKRYDLKDISSVKQTMVQQNPLDFPEVKNHEVYIVDVITAIPIPEKVLQNALSVELNVPTKYVVIRSEFDPLELETEHLNDDSEYITIMTTENEYPEVKKDTESYFGDEYNARLVKSLTKDKDKFERPSKNIAPNGQYTGKSK